MGASCSDCVPTLSSGRIQKRESVVPEQFSHSLIRKSNRDLTHHVDAPVTLVASINEDHDGVFFDKLSSTLTGADFVVLPLGEINDDNNRLIAPGHRNIELGKYVYFIES